MGATVSHRTPIVLAKQEVSIPSVIANAEYEVIEPSAPWKFLIAGVIEHGGRASQQELCEHLLGVSYHPLVARLLALATVSGDLVEREGHWFIGDSAKAVLERDDQTVQRIGEISFFLDFDQGRVIDAEIDDSGQLGDAINQNENEFADDKEVQIAHRCVGRWLESKIRVTKIIPPVLKGGVRKISHKGAVSISDVEKERMISHAVESEGFFWDSEHQTARSSFVHLVLRGDVVTSRYLSLHVDEFELADGTTLNDIDLLDVPWSPSETEENVERRLAIAEVSMGLNHVVDRNQWDMMFGLTPGGRPTRSEVGEVLEEVGRLHQAKLVLAGEDWAL